MIAAAWYEHMELPKQDFAVLQVFKLLQILKPELSVHSKKPAAVSYLFVCMFRMFEDLLFWLRSPI